MPEVDYSVDAAVFAGVPNYRRIVLLAEGCSNPGANAALESDLRREIKQLEDDKVDITNPKIACWWDAYKAVGIKGEKSKVQPGVSALLRRISKGQGDKIPFISALVALTNLVALKHLCPTGAFDFSKIKGPIVLAANGAPSTKELDRSHPPVLRSAAGKWPNPIEQTSSHRRIGLGLIWAP